MRALPETSRFFTLNDEAFGALEIRVIGRQLFDRASGNPAVQIIRIGQWFVEQRFCAEHAIVRQRASAEQNAIRSDKTIVADLHGRRGLAIFFKIDGMRENLRPKSGEGRELPHGDGIGAIDQVPVRDSGMFADNELWLAPGFLGEMTGGPKGKSCDPVAIPERSVRFEMKERDVLANGELPDTRALLHD